jgi:hypothetical protein
LRAGARRRNSVAMRVVFAGRPDSERLDVWQLIGTRGCCTFVCRSRPGRGFEITVGAGCRSCLKEVNAFAMRRGHHIKLISNH